LSDFDSFQSPSAWESDILCVMGACIERVLFYVVECTERQLHADEH